MLFDLSFFIVLLLFILCVVFSVSPVKGYGIFNFMLGLTTLVCGATVALGFTGATELIEQLFMVFVVMTAVYTILRADGIGVF